ncbi:MAG: lysine--tRNA ligase, partial [Selenomonas sp.]|nr:lysine--tRNA ligase [Selenomonas sp.]
MAENKQQQAPVEDLNEMMKVRREKMEAFKELGVAPFGHRYEVTAYAADIKKEYDGLEGDEEGPEVFIAGRLMAIRGHGKASFCTLNDRTGNIQVYFKIDVLGEEKYKGQFRRLDIGDIIGIRGVVFKTHRGEVTVRV